MTAESSTWTPDWAVPPGEILQEALEDRGLSQAELARRMNRPIKTINEIVNGKAAVTPDTAIQLERALGISANLWLGMESNFRHALARMADVEALQQESDFVKKFPLRDLRRLGIVQGRSATADTAMELLRFFGVSSPAAWRRVWLSPEAAFRVSASTTSTPEALASWVRLGELRATAAQTDTYDAPKLRRLLEEIRGWTRLDPIETVIKRVQTTLADVGVVFVLVPEVTGAPVSGAAYGIGKLKRVLQMSLRYKRDDQFWFTFFHEAGHLLGRAGTRLHIDVPDAPGTADDEAEADEFARETLLPRDQYEAFVESQLFDQHAIQAFARVAGVSPGIVVGRLQRDGHVPHASPLNRLKRPIRWEANA